MPGMPERHSKDCKVSVGSKATAHRREIRLDFSATDARVRFGSKADMCSAQADVRFVPIADIGKTSGATKRMGPSPVLVLRAAERNQNANYEVQA